MKVSCPTCDSKYTIADDKVSGRKVKVRCKSCGGQILVDGTIPFPAATASDAPAADSDEDDATRVFTGAERNAFDADFDKGVETSTASSKTGNVTSAETSTLSQSVELIWSVNVSETEERSLTTEQLIDAVIGHELEGEVYVWHDGLSDWKLIADVPELVSAIEAKKSKGQQAKVSPRTVGAAKSKAATDKSSPKAASSPSNETASQTPPPAALAKKASPIVLGKAAEALKAKNAAKVAGKGGEGGPDPRADVAGKPLSVEKKAAARLPGAKRPQSAHDLFAAAGQQSEGEDFDVSESNEEEDKKLGARNESSVLFSLDALKAGISSPQAASATKAPQGRKGGPPQAPKKKLEDLMSGAAPAPLMPGMGPGPMMFSSNQSLLTAPAPPPPKPEPKPVSIAAPAAVVGASSYEQPAQKKSKKVVAIAAVAAVLVIGGVVFALSGGNSSKEQTVASASALPSQALPASEPVKTAEPVVEEKKAEAVASTSTAPSTGPVAAATPGKTGAVAVGPAKTADTKKDKEPPKKEEPSGPVSSGVASFNADSARQALSVAASQTSSCKKVDGPTGSGKVQITFAPSGRVTTANVMGPPFAGTPVGGCVSSVFRRARVPAFSGDPVTVSKSFSITQ